MKVRLYVKAKTRGTVREWLEDHYLPVEMEDAFMSAYSNYFVVDRSIAQQIREEYPQRDMRITEHY